MGSCQHPPRHLLIGRYGFDLAVVLSASHNPYQDNGIKFFAADGYKLSDEAEVQIDEVRSSRASGRDHDEAASIGAIRQLHGTTEDYLRELHTRFSNLSLNGLNVLLDCANGATHRAAPEIFRRLGANVTVLADRPDGRNINAGCGSTHIEKSGAKPWLKAITPWVLPLTAMVTACSPSTATVRSSTATNLWHS